MCAGLGAAVEQLNQVELAVLTNLLQGQTDLSLPQVAQLLNLSNPETLSQSLSALSEASDHQGATEDQAQQSAVTTRPPEPPAESLEPSPSAGDASMSQEEQAKLLAILLTHIIKPQEEQSDESNGVQSEEALACNSSAATTDRKGKSGF